jgi:hypothetical protein
MNRQTEKIYRELRINRVFFFLFIFLSIFILPFFFGRLNILNDAYRSNDWPTVDAKINKFDALTSSCATEFSNSIKAYMCKYNLEYSYLVAGKSYLNNRVAFLGKPLYQDLKRQFDGNAPLTISYQPDNPSNSVLLPGDSYHHGGEFVVVTEIFLGLLTLGGLIWTGLNLIFIRVQLKTILGNIGLSNGRKHSNFLPVNKPTTKR